MLRPPLEVSGGAGLRPAATDAASSSDDDDDPDAHLDGVGALFLTTRFITRTLTVRAWPACATPHSLTLSVSAAASTDFDLTGQALWPASAILADFIAGTEEGVNAVGGARAVVELGAGLGLAGLAAAACAAVVAPLGAVSLTLTDGEPSILPVLRENAAAFSAVRPGVSPPAVALLPWGSDAAAAALVAATPAAARQGGFDVLLGADVTYSLSAVPALFSTATALASKEGGSRFYLGYVSRSAALDRAVPAAADAEGWGSGREVPGTRRAMPCGALEGWVLAFERSML